MKHALTVLALALVASTGFAADNRPAVDPDPNVSDSAALGHPMGPVTSDGATAPYIITKKKEVQVVGIQIFDDDTNWDGAEATVQVRLCDSIDSATVTCPWVNSPNTSWPKTSDATGLVGNFEVYEDMEIRLNVASSGAGTSLYWVIQQ